MISESDVRKELISYLKDSSSLAEFEDWLVSKSWNMHLDSDQPANDLVAEIKLLLAEYSSSLLTLRELRESLSDTIQFIEARLFAPRIIIQPITGSSAARLRQAPSFAVPA